MLNGPVDDLVAAFTCIHVYCYAYIVNLVFTIFLTSLSLYLGTLSAAKIIHKFLLGRVLRASMPNFFDITPVGRILNRFSKDIDEVDNDLPSTLRAWSACFFGVHYPLFPLYTTT